MLAASNGIAASRVEAVLEETWLGNVGARRIKTLSLGMRQPLGIAAALLGDPEVAMADEPSNGLDPEGIMWIRELMKRLAREGRTALVSSLMNETAAFADLLVVLGRVRLLADTPMREFLDSRSRPRVRLRTTEPARLRSVLTARDLTAVQAADGRGTIDGVTAEEIGTLAAGSGIPLLELPDERASLEQAHLALTPDGIAFAASPVRRRDHDLTAVLRSEWIKTTSVRSIYDPRRPSRPPRSLSPSSPFGPPARNRRSGREPRRSSTPSTRWTSGRSRPSRPVRRRSPRSSSTEPCACRLPRRPAAPSSTRRR